MLRSALAARALLGIRLVVRLQEITHQKPNDSLRPVSVLRRPTREHRNYPQPAREE